MQADARPGLGLAATYYLDASMSPSSAVRSVGEAGAGRIDWSGAAGAGAPAFSLVDTAGNFSARWAGFLSPSISSTYTFEVAVVSPEDRVKLWLDNALIVDQWASLSALSSERTVQLNTSNDFYAIVVEYQHSDDPAGNSSASGAALRWTGPRKVASEYLYPSNYATESAIYSLSLTGAADVTLSVGGATVLTSLGKAVTSAKRFEGSAFLKRNDMYQIQVQARNLGAGQAVKLEWATPWYTTARAVPSERLFASSRVQDHIQGSPFRLYTAAAPADAASSSFSLDGEPTTRVVGEAQVVSGLLIDGAATTRVVGEAQDVSVLLRDSRSNHVAVLQDETRWAVAVLRHAPAEYYSSFSSEHIARLPRHRYARLDQSDGTRLSSSLATTAAGTHTILAHLATPGGLSATYFSSPSLSPLSATGALASVGGPLDFSSGTPAVLSGASTSGFAARWAGFLLPNSTATYTLSASLASAEERVTAPNNPAP
ncbi:hypothetical protein T484DRAFT_1818747 [Baffinella frigidus]|nr:hypothetical protein T484DRAFT_1818747 [Cryptophyta sp. CCMP2293]